jgi:hypothetical protein
VKAVVGLHLLGLAGWVALAYVVHEGAWASTERLGEQADRAAPGVAAITTAPDERKRQRVQEPDSR